MTPSQTLSYALTHCTRSLPVFYSQDGGVVPGTPYYHQSLWHNLVLMATWGVPNIKLAFIDLVS